MTRDKIAGCEAALKAAERQLGDLETSVPRARMEAGAEQAKADDIQQRLDELKAATEVEARPLLECHDAVLPS